MQSQTLEDLMHKGRQLLIHFQDEIAALALWPHIIHD